MTILVWDKTIWNIVSSPQLQFLQNYATYDEIKLDFLDLQWERSSLFLSLKKRKMVAACYIHSTDSTDVMILY